MKHCNKQFEPKKANEVFCSLNCRTRFHSLNQQRKDIHSNCEDCNKDFKQTSTMQLICLDCREKRRWVPKEKVIDKFPELDRKKELDMQKEWIKKNKVTKGF